MTPVWWECSHVINPMLYGALLVYPLEKFLLANKDLSADSLQRDFQTITRDHTTASLSWFAMKNQITETCL
ncbi:MAG: hypothetical protein V3S24_11300 [Candidatus Tectomicrobia bacterium]